MCGSEQTIILLDKHQCKKYGEDVGTLVEGRSYLLKNLRLNVVKNKCFLNTTLNNKFMFEVIEAINNLSDSTCEEIKVKVICKIIGVSSVKKLFCCPQCMKRGQDDNGQVFSGAVDA